MLKLLLMLLTIPLQGVVKTPEGKGIKGVVVSDGYTCTVTDCHGRYKLEADSLARTISVCIPSKYEAPRLTDGRQGFFNYIGSGQTDFTLIPRQGSSDKFSLVAIADAHIKNDHARDRFKNESIPDIYNTMDKLSKEGPVVGITLGDQLSDNMERTEEVISLLPGFFYTIGNHDHNTKGGTNEYAVTDYYVRNVGPTDYSFDVGQVHFVVMDDIQYTGVQKQNWKIAYYSGFTDEQMKWLGQDISLVKNKGKKAVVLCVHGPVFGRFTHKDELKDLLSQFSEAHIISGHEHNINNVWLSDKIWEHNIQSIGGAWWFSNLSPNGSPLGYLVMKFDGGKMSCEYNKATTEDESFQMRVYDGDDIYTPDTPNPANEGVKRRDKTYGWPENLKGHFVVRVWDGTPGWEVKFVQNGVETPMKQTQEKFFDALTAEYMVAVHGAPFGGSAAYRPLVDSFWTLPAPCGDPAKEQGWEIVAIHREPSGEMKEYRCDKLTRDFRGLAEGARYAR